MLKLDGQKLDDGRWFTGSVERNKDPILNLLKRVPPVPFLFWKSQQYWTTCGTFCQSVAGARVECLVERIPVRLILVDSYDPHGEERRSEESSGFHLCVAAARLEPCGPRPGRPRLRDGRYR